MTELQPYQIMTVIAFLAVLVLIQVAIKLFRGQDLLRPAQKRMRVVETLTVGPKERLLLVEIDEQETLVGVSKQGSVSILDFKTKIGGPSDA